MIEKILKNRVLLTIFLSISIFIFVSVFSYFGYFYIFDKKIQNNYYDIKNTLTGVKASKDIVIVEIDEKTLQKLGRFPFDRKTYIPIIENINSKNAAVIAFDIIFVDKTSPLSDLKFSKAIENAKNIVFGLSLGSNGILEQPLDIFSEHLLTKGYFRPNIDTATQTVYSITPYASFNDRKVYEHFSLAVLKAYYSYIYAKDYINTEPKIQDGHYFVTEKVRIPLSRPEKRELLINYIDRSKFTKVSFIDVYDKESFEALSKSIDFEDKIVLIGATAKGIKDIFYIPSGIEYGVYTHANMINTTLTKSFLSYFDKNIERILIFLLIVLSVYFNLSRSGYVLIFSNIAIVTIFLVIFPASVISLTNLIINFPIELIFALIASLTLSNIMKYIIENKYKNKLNKALSEYVSKDIATEIMMGHGKVNLDGENKHIAIFFSDIEGFTTISEKFSPEELVGFLREYLGEMSNIIMDEKGFINKYEGDAIMALWGVFGESSQDSYNACKSALFQQEALTRLNVGWTARGFSPIKARIGLHSGRAIIGNIGSQGRKMEFTALGDSVNLASRLEGVNKFYGTYICVSEDIYNDTRDQFEFRYLDKIRVKGKNNPVKIYELLGFKENTSEKKLEIASKFEIAISLYEEKKFSEAKKIFQDLENMGDTPSQTYKDRCNLYIENPPEMLWDGVWTMTSK